MSAHTSQIDTVDSTQTTHRDSTQTLNSSHAQFQVHTMVMLTNQVSWDVTVCCGQVLHSVWSNQSTFTSRVMQSSCTAWPQVLRSCNPSIHEGIHAQQHSATCQMICTIQSSHDSSQGTDLVVMLVGQWTSPEWYSILHMYSEAVAESILHQVVMLLLLQCHTHCRKCCDDRRWHKTGRLLLFTFCCSCRRHGITKSTVEYAWNTAMMVGMVTIAVVLVAAASTKFAITFHILTHTDQSIRYNSIPVDITIHNCTTYENLRHFYLARLQLS